MTIERFLYGAFIVMLAYFLGQVVYFAILAAMGFIQQHTRIYESGEEDYSLMTVSDYTVPVSIILPAKNEEIWIKDSLRAILNLDYPNYEVIIVNDGSTDNTMDILNEMLELKAIDMVYPDRFSHGKINEVYKSGL